MKTVALHALAILFVLACGATNLAVHYYAIKWIVAH